MLWSFKYVGYLGSVVLKMRFYVDHIIIMKPLRSSIDHKTTNIKTLNLFISLAVVSLFLLFLMIGLITCQHGFYIPCISLIRNFHHQLLTVLKQIIEEGPITVAPLETVKKLEQAARRLAKSVNYVGAATVEYLYSMETGEYFFLELNPRLQVSVFLSTTRIYIYFMTTFLTSQNLSFSGGASCH